MIVWLLEVLCSHIVGLLIATPGGDSNELGVGLVDLWRSLPPLVLSLTLCLTLTWNTGSWLAMETMDVERSHGVCIKLAWLKMM